MAHGQAGAEIGHDLAPTLTTVHEAPITAYCSEITSALCAADGPKGVSDQYAHEGKLIVQKDIVGAITARYGGNAMGAPEVDAGLYIPVNVAYGFQPRIARNGRGDMGDVVSALTAQAGEDGTGRGQPIVAATREIAQTITSNYGKQIDNTDSALGPNVALHGMAVRRLTPRECERLQGFPDNWTLVPVKGKPAADGPRYKALGNSMAVPCMRWLGYRLILTHSEYGIK
jgi:DNA (cytosine-5)-methyltransferase 1